MRLSSAKFVPPITFKRCNGSIFFSTINVIHEGGRWGEGADEKLISTRGRGFM